MDKSYMKFIIAYDFGHRFDAMELACDEAFELAEQIANFYIRDTLVEDRDYQTLYDYCEDLDFKLIWDSVRDMNKSGLVWNGVNYSKKGDGSMNRIDKIAQFAQRKEQEKLSKEQEEMRQIAEYKAKIREFKPRIDELLTVGNACLKHGIALTGKAWGGHEGYDTHQFITNSWSHLLGFVHEYSQILNSYKPFTQLGIMGGGACNFNLKTDGLYIDVSGSELYVLKRFVNEFDEFEREFYKYVDNVTR